MYDVEPSISENTSSAPDRKKKWLIDLNSHSIILGRSGTGKSNYIKNIIKHLERMECNIVLLDPHGSVSEYAIMNSSKSILFLSGVDYPGSEGIYSGINVLENSGSLEEANLVGDWLRRAFETESSLSMGTWGPRLNFIFGGVLVSLMHYEQGITLKEFAEILSNGKRLLSYFPPGSSPHIINFLEMQASNKRQWSDFISSTLNKLNPLLLSPPVMRMISAPRGKGADLEGAIYGINNIIVPEINIGLTGEISMGVIASLILSKIWNLLNRRGETEKLTYIIIDEAASIPSEIVDVFLSQGRKYGIRLILIYQTLTVVSKKTVSSILSNAGNYVCFNLSRDDIDLVVREIYHGSRKKNLEYVLSEQGRHHATIMCRTSTTGDGSSSSKHYGPITVLPPYVADHYTDEIVAARKADLVKKAGHPYRLIEKRKPGEIHHDRMIDLFYGYLESKEIKAFVEPNFRGLIPDILIQHKDKYIICEVEFSDLLVPGKIARKLYDYAEYEMFFLIRDEDFPALINILKNMMLDVSTTSFYYSERGKVPRSVLPHALLNLSVLLYRDREFKFFNGVGMVRFLPRHLDARSSFLNRARKLPYGALRENVVKDIAENIRNGGNEAWDEIEKKYGKRRIEQLRLNLRERGYGDAMNLNSILEIDRIIS